MAIIPTGCGVSLDLTDSLTKVDDMINDILNGIGDVTGAIADAVATALGNLAISLGKMLPDISGLIPDISFQSEITALLGLVEGSLAYVTKLAEMTVQFGEALLGAGLSIFDLVADAAAGLLSGLDPCSLIPEFKIGADGIAAATPNNISFAGIAAVKELKAVSAEPVAPIKVKRTQIKPITVQTKEQPTLGTATPVATSISLQDANTASSAGQTASTNTSTGLGTSTTTY